MLNDARFDSLVTWWTSRFQQSLAVPRLDMSDIVDLPDLCAVGRRQALSGYIMDCCPCGFRCLLNDVLRCVPEEICIARNSGIIAESVVSRVDG